MMLRGSLLTFRILRFETVVIVGAAVLSVAVSALVILAVNAGGFAHCLASDEASFDAACQAGVFPWLARVARLSAAIVPIFPLVAGLLAGGPVVARELESGTARLAWSLGPSRLRWLVQRALPALAVAALASLAIGLTAEALLHLLLPSVDLDHSFVAFRARGLIVGMQAILAASIALAFGAILGRAVPTFIATVVLVSGLSIALDRVERDILTGEAVVSSAETFAYDNRDLLLDNRLQFPDGSILTWDEATRIHPEIQNGFDETSAIRGVVLYVPGDRYHEIERREALILGFLSLAFFGLAAAAVVRRRPR